MPLSGDPPEVQLEKLFGARLDGLCEKILSEFRAAGLYAKLAEKTPAWRCFTIARDPIGLDLLHGAGNLALKHVWPARMLFEAVAFVPGKHGAFDQVPIWNRNALFPAPSIILDQAEAEPLGKKYLEVFLASLPPASPKHWMPERKT